MSYQLKYNYNGIFRRASVDTLDLKSVKSNARKLFNVSNNEKLVLTWTDEEGDEVHMNSPAEFEIFLRFFEYFRRIEGPVKFGVRTEPKPNAGRNKAAKRAETSDGGSYSDSADCTDSTNSHKAVSNATREAMSAGRVLHRGVACSGCNIRPIEGTRYKCAGRDDYNLCAACEAIAEHPFPMLKMKEPTVGSMIRLKGHGFGPNINKRYAEGSVPIPTPPPLEGSAIHVGVSCSKCQKGTIVGSRYKCTVRTEYNLCEQCEASEKHQYPLIKIYRPDPTVFVKGWGTGGAVTPANPLGLKHFSAPKYQKEHKEVIGAKVNQRAARMLEQQPNNGHQRKLPMVRFAGDVTVPDGTVFSPSVEFTKTWLVRNDGTSDWDVYGRDVHLIAAGGDFLCDPCLSIPVQCLKAGEEGCFSVKLKAPMCPGRYVAYFRIQGGDGKVFGQKLWADIVVRSPIIASGGDATTAIADAKIVEDAKQVPDPVPEGLSEKPDVIDANAEVLDEQFLEGDYDVVYPAADPISPDDASWAAEREEMERMWKVELDTLRGMGFYDTRLNVLLLKEHARVSIAQHPEMHGRPFSDSLSAIVDALVK